jgi:hypothetical protein
MGEIRMTPAPAPLRVKESSKYMLQCSRVTGVGDCCVSVHSTTKSTNAWNLIAFLGHTLCRVP